MLFQQSLPARAVLKAMSCGEILFSQATWQELNDVLARNKFKSYFSSTIRIAFVNELNRLAKFVTIPTPIRACRDPHDDIFLEVAVHGNADLILSGDEDLLCLHPFQGIAILSPADFLERQG
jgi:putative PIN family toxin of toxin-antitoxin system